MLMKEAPAWADVMPGGENLLLERDGTLVERSIKDSSEKKLTTLQAGEKPLDWAKEPMHLFTQVVGATEVRVNKLDLTSGRREEWFAFKPQSQGSHAGCHLREHHAGRQVDDVQLCGAGGAILCE